MLVGPWDSSNGTKFLTPFTVIEKRRNMHGFPLVIGRKHSSQKTLDAGVDEDVIEDEDDEYNLNEIMKCITTYANSSYVNLQFPYFYFLRNYQLFQLQISFISIARQRRFGR